MTSSCTVALTANYSTQITNMNLEVSRLMDIYTTGKLYHVALVTSPPILEQNLNNIENVYNQGYKIQESYPGIPQSVLNENGIDGNFWKNNIVVDFAKQSCYGAGTCHYCQYETAAGKACCACGKNYNCVKDGTC
jgi:hypothetical protein